MANDFSKITIKGDNDPLKESLDAAFGMFQEWGERVKYTVQDLLGAQSFDEIWSKIKGVVEVFEASEAAVKRLGYAMKATGDVTGFSTKQMGEMNTQLRKVVDASTDEITAAQNALVKYTNVRQRAEGNIFQQTIKGASDLAAALGKDLVPSVDALGAALQDPKNSFSELAELGITFTSQQKKMIAALQDTGRGAKAQQIILKELQDTYGGAGEAAANTFGAKMRKLEEYYDSAWKKLGGFLVPALNTFIDAIEKVNRVLDYYQAQITEWFDDLLKGMTESLGGSTDWLKKFADMAVMAFTIAQTAVAEWQSFLIGGFYYVAKASKEIFAQISDVIVKWVEQLGPVWEMLGTGASAAWDAIKDMSKSAFEYAGDWAKYLYEQFNKAFEAMVKGFGYAIDAMKDIAANFIADPFSGGDIKTDVFTKLLGKQLKGLTPDFGGDRPERPGDNKDWKGDLSAKMQDFFDKFKAGSKNLWDGMDKDLEPFLAKFGANLANNSQTFEDFYAKIKKIMDGDPYADVNGDKSGKFKRSGDGKGHGGGLEDLMALNRRITGAAARSPEMAELQKQTSIAGRQLRELESIRKHSERVKDRADREKTIAQQSAVGAPMLAGGGQW
jgi:hypothetical protein